MVLNENFKEFIKLLNANEVKYLVVGGSTGRLKDKVDVQTLERKAKKRKK
jgi:hypothetical protein